VDGGGSIADQDGFQALLMQRTEDSTEERGGIHKGKNTR
jgi:hypothetical protein